MHADDPRLMPQGDDPLSMRQLEVFVALVEQGSFTRAARHLGLSQSTVSGHMADLERRLGSRLVDRDRTGVRVTAAGDVLIQHARDVLRAEQNARMAVAQLNGLLTGRLTVGASSIPAIYLLPLHLADFHERHPEVGLHVETGDSDSIRSAVSAGAVDIGVVGSDDADAGLPHTKIAGDRVVLIAPANHALAGCGSVSLNDVSRFPIIMRESGSGTRAAVLGAVNVKAQPFPRRVSCTVGSTEAAKAAVRAGLGLSWVSHLSVREDVQHGVFAIIDVDDIQIARPFYVVTRAEELVSPAGRMFRDELVAGAGEAS